MKGWVPGAGGGGGGQEIASGCLMEADSGRWRSGGGRWRRRQNEVNARHAAELAPNGGQGGDCAVRVLHRNLKTEGGSGKGQAQVAAVSSERR